MDKERAVVSHKKLAGLVPGKLIPGLKVEKFKSSKIQLYTVDNFLSKSDCEKLIDVIGDQFRLSTLTQYDADIGFRTSETCDLGWIDHPHVKQIEERISKCMGIRLTYAQNTEAQKYSVGQEFKAHFDAYTDGYSPEQDRHKARYGQRTWTFMVYLADTTKGGGTRFPKLDQVFYPKQGKAVIWNNLNKDGSRNLNALHQGLPVEEGTKIIITKWFVDRGNGKAWL